MPPIPELPAEIPFQVYGDYSRERLIRDLQDLYRVAKELVELVNDLEARVIVLEGP